MKVTSLSVANMLAGVDKACNGFETCERVVAASSVVNSDASKSFCEVGLACCRHINDCCGVFCRLSQTQSGKETKGPRQ